MGFQTKTENHCGTAEKRGGGGKTGGGVTREEGEAGWKEHQGKTTLRRTGKIPYPHHEVDGNNVGEMWGKQHILPRGYTRGKSKSLILKRIGGEKCGKGDRSTYINSTIGTEEGTG